MKIFIVQMRIEHGGPLVFLGKFKARDERGAIRQGLEILTYNGENAVELIATAEG